MNTQYKNAQFVQVSSTMQVAGAVPANGNPLTWSRPMPLKATAKPGRIEKKILHAMDHFFTILLLLSGEEEYETISIGHIL